jgi:hypothetical protein
VPHISYQFEIDFDNDDVWGEAGHDISARVLDDAGFTCERGRDAVRQLAPPAAGRADLGSIDNRSKDYSPDNAAGPLYGNLVPGRNARAQATHDGTTYALWAGIADDIEQQPEEKRVAIPLLGTFSRLAGRTISTALYEGWSTSDAITVILNKCGWPALARQIEPGQTTLSWWWLDEADAFSAIAQLVAAEGPGACAFEAANGDFVFHNRHHRRVAARSTTAQATITDGAGGGPLYHTSPFAYSSRLKEVVNTVSIPVEMRALGEVEEVWALDAPLHLGGAQTVVLDARTSAPFWPAGATVAYTVILGAATVTLGVADAQSVPVTIAAGPFGAWIEGLALLAQPLTKLAELRVPATVDTSASVAKYGVRTYDVPTWPAISVNTAHDFANAIATAYQEPRAAATITLVGADDAHREECLTREIGDRIRVGEAQTGLDADMFVEWVGHAVDWGGRRHVTRLGCEVAVGAATLLTVDSADAVADDPQAIVTY